MRHYANHFTWHAVQPDFFADDIVADARRLPMPKAELPSEHFLLHMIPGEEAIVMGVWNVAGQDVRVHLQPRHRLSVSAHLTDVLALPVSGLFW